MIHLLAAFLLGVILSNLLQWGKWNKVHPEAPPWSGYWASLGFYHVSTNLLFDAVIFCLWTATWLDDAANLALHLIPGIPEVYYVHGDLPLMPQVGLMLGGGADLFGDLITFYLRKAVGGKLHALLASVGPKEET